MYARESACELIFLCELHSARVDDYCDFIGEVYGGRGWNVSWFYGGYSNNYVVMWRSGINVSSSQLAKFGTRQCGF